MGYSDRRGNITIDALYRYDGTNKSVYMTFKILFICLFTLYINYL